MATPAGTWSFAFYNALNPKAGAFKLRHTTSSIFDDSVKYSPCVDSDSHLLISDIPMPDQRHSYLNLRIQFVSCGITETGQQPSPRDASLSLLEDGTSLFILTSDPTEQYINYRTHTLPLPSMAKWMALNTQVNPRDPFLGSYMFLLPPSSLLSLSPSPPPPYTAAVLAAATSSTVLANPHSARDNNSESISRDRNQARVLSEACYLMYSDYNSLEPPQCAYRVSSTDINIVDWNIYSCSDLQGENCPLNRTVDSSMGLIRPQEMLWIVLTNRGISLFKTQSRAESLVQDDPVSVTSGGIVQQQTSIQYRFIMTLLVLWVILSCVATFVFVGKSLRGVRRLRGGVGGGAGGWYIGDNSTGNEDIELMVDLDAAGAGAYSPVPVHGDDGSNHNHHNNHDDNHDNTTIRNSSRDPTITDGNSSAANIVSSPNGREILVATPVEQVLRDLAGYDDYDSDDVGGQNDDFDLDVESELWYDYYNGINGINQDVGVLITSNRQEHTNVGSSSSSSNNTYHASTSTNTGDDDTEGEGGGEGGGGVGERRHSNSHTNSSNNDNNSSNGSHGSSNRVAASTSLDQHYSSGAYNNNDYDVNDDIETGNVATMATSTAAAAEPLLLLQPSIPPHIQSSANNSSSSSSTSNNSASSRLRSLFSNAIGRQGDNTSAISTTYTTTSIRDDGQEIGRRQTTGDDGQEVIVPTTAVFISPPAVEMYYHSARNAPTAAAATTSTVAGDGDDCVVTARLLH